MYWYFSAHNLIFSGYKAAFMINNDLGNWNIICYRLPM